MTVDSTALPGGRDEIEFLQEYEASTLWKPQVVADNVLNGIFLADAAHRALLAALMMQEVAEAARRLNHVWMALTDRSRSVARTLAGPLPGADDWERLCDVLDAVQEPEQIVDLLNLDASIGESAEEMVAYGEGGFRFFATAIRLTEAGPPATGVEGGYPPVLLLTNRAPSGEPLEARLELADDRVIALGDATGDFVTWSRDFLAAYLDARLGRNGE
jgi:hypothetical protein